MYHDLFKLNIPFEKFERGVSAGFLIGSTVLTSVSLDFYKVLYLYRVPDKNSKNKPMNFSGFVSM